MSKDPDMDMLWQAINNWIAAKKEYGKAYEEYDGYSWDWAGHNVIKAVEEAQECAENVIGRIIDRRIKAILAATKKS